MWSFLSSRYRYRCASVVLLAALWLYYKRKRRLNSLKNTAVLEGFIAKGFEGVKKQCLENILSDREDGVQLCCYHKGKKVVDLSGGRSPMKRMFPESLSVIFSCSKVLESLVIAMLVDRGLLDYDTPIAQYWPEFGDKICEKIKVKDLMRHQSGLSGVVKPLSSETLGNPEKLAMELLSQRCAFNPYDDSEEAKRIAERERLHVMRTADVDGFTQKVEPGAKRQAYNAVTRGFYSSELVRQVDPSSRTLAEYFEEEVALKLERTSTATGREGRDCYIGCPESQQARVLQPSEESPLSAIFRVVSNLLLPKWLLGWIYDDFGRIYEYEKRVIKNLFHSERRKLAVQAYFTIQEATAPTVIAGSPEIRSIPMASVTGVSNAKAMACIFSDLDLFLSHQGLQRALNTEGPGVDEILARPVTYTAAGWGADRFEFVGAKGWYGWGGLGGSLLLFHPDTKSSFAYVPSRLNKRLFKPRGISCLKEFIAAIEKLG